MDGPFTSHSGRSDPVRPRNCAATYTWSSAWSSRSIESNRATATAGPSTDAVPDPESTAATTTITDAESAGADVDWLSVQPDETADGAGSTTYFLLPGSVDTSNQYRQCSTSHHPAIPARIWPADARTAHDWSNALSRTTKSGSRDEPVPAVGATTHDAGSSTAGSPADPLRPTKDQDCRTSQRSSNPQGQS
jgi:hypothetical protein